VLRHELLGRISRRRLGRAVEVADGDRAILEGKGREERLGEAMLLDQSLTDDPKDLCPDFADCVDTPVPGLVECLVRGRVDGFILRSSQHQTQYKHTGM
jgi:hypothetical protein